MDYSTKTRAELLALCKERGFKGYSTKKKDALATLLTEAPQPPQQPQTTPAQPHLHPLVKWSGGKGDEIPEILKHLPPSYTTYLEPFVGGGALYFHLAPQKAVVNDIHPDLIALYKVIGQGQRAELKAFMDAHKNDEQTYYEVRNKAPRTTDLEKAKQFYYLRKTCYRGMLRYNSSGKMNIPYGRYKSINYEDLDNPAYEDLLKRTTILNGGFEEIFKNYNSPENFMFLDPPYDSKFTNYGYCSFGREEHEALAKCFKETSIKCLLVIGKTDFISELYKDYIVAEYPKKYKFKLHSGRVGDEINVSHLVIKNY
jgi:DNA adenine methylase